MNETVKTIYVDYDGVLAYFLKDSSLEEVAMPGYALKVPMVDTVCDAISMLLYDTSLDGYDIRVLSAVINDDAKNDKLTMLTKRFGEGFANKAVFVKYGDSKASYAKGGNILIDDFSYNLHQWQAYGGVGVKVYNDINGNHGTWHGYSVHSQAGAIVIYKTLKGILMALESKAA